MVKRKPIPTQLCVRCGVFQAEGKPRERLRQFRLHWPNCVGYPMREIEMVAEKMEAEFARLFPITQAAFDQYGRVSP